MTGHFTTADGCERWGPLESDQVESFYRVPFPVQQEVDQQFLFTPRGNTYKFRLYKLVGFEPSKGLAHYKEVYDGR